MLKPLRDLYCILYKNDGHSPSEEIHYHSTTIEQLLSKICSISSIHVEHSMQEAQQPRTGQAPTPIIDSHCTSSLRAHHWVYVTEAGDEYPDQTFLNLSPTAIPELDAPPPTWLAYPNSPLAADITSPSQTSLPRWLTHTNTIATTDFPPRLPDDPSFLTIATPRPLLLGLTTLLQHARLHPRFPSALLHLFLAPRQHFQTHRARLLLC